ncbi:MAG: hypothetical protein M1832_004689 [Thelocarpon impressellum]|nr:MAG: hypothetical protein M1832_004689 [Thelocarpon impressellum]
MGLQKRATEQSDSDDSPRVPVKRNKRLPPPTAAAGRPRRSTAAATKEDYTPDSAHEPSMARAPDRRRKGKDKRGKQGASTGSTVSVEIERRRVESGPEEDDDDGDERQYWLMKAEPEARIVNGVKVSYSIDELMCAEEPEAWDGVRNYSARNNMKAMSEGDLVFFYHSNCKVPGIVGVMEIVREATTDESAFNETHPYHDPKSSRDKPRWVVVHVRFVRKFAAPMSLKTLRSFGLPGGVLADMQVLRMSRLSVSRVMGREWRFIMGFIEAEEERMRDEDDDEGKDTKRQQQENGHGEGADPKQQKHEAEEEEGHARTHDGPDELSPAADAQSHSHVA